MSLQYERLVNLAFTPYLPPVLDQHEVAGGLIDLREEHELAILRNRYAADPFGSGLFERIDRPRFPGLEIEEIDYRLAIRVGEKVDARLSGKPFITPAT